MALHSNPDPVADGRQVAACLSDSQGEPLHALTSSMHEEFEAEFAGAALRLAPDHGYILAYSGERPSPFPNLPLIRSEGRLMPDPQQVRNLVGWSELQYQRGTLDLILGRARALTPAELRRFAAARQEAQHALNRFCLKRYEMILARQEERARAYQQEARHWHSQLAGHVEAVQEWAHDLLNDLTPLLGATEDLYDVLQHQESSRWVIQIERQTARIHQRLREGLQGKLAICAPQDLTHLTGELAQVWGMLLENRNQSFTCNLPARALWVQGREQELVRIVNNLLSNAQKYTPPGGMISLVLRAEGSNASIEVEDSGMGMAPELRTQLFQGQVRGPHAHIEGNGLGLLQVQRTLERLGGSIAVESEPHVGSRFLVSLPLVHSGAEVVHSSKPWHDARSGE